MRTRLSVVSLLCFVILGCKNDCPDGDVACAESAADDESGGSGPVKEQAEEVNFRGDAEGSPDWHLDSVEGAVDGDLAVHPPPMRQGDSATMLFDCRGSQVTFTMRRRYGLGDLQLIIDGDSHGILVDPTWGGNQSGTELNFVLPEGEHSFEFIASANADAFEDGRIPFILDAFSCSSAAAEPGPNGLVDFDDGYVPPELSGSWHVSNAHGTRDGVAAVHPPPLDKGDSSSTTFTCDATQVSFVMRRRYGLGDLELLIDDDSHGIIIDPTWGGNQSGTEFNFVLPEGKHSLKFIASANADGFEDGRIPFILDAFSCSSTAAEPGPNGLVDFDEGYVPPELSGSWHVSNVHGTHEGAAAVHPPPLQKGDSFSMTFACDAAQISFVMKRRYGLGDLARVIDGVPGEVLIDPTWGGNQSGTELTLSLDGANSLELIATANADDFEGAHVPFVLDTFACK